MFERDIFGEEHHQFRETVRRFFRKEVEPYAAQWEAGGMFPRDIFRKAGAAGLLQVGMPAEYGGGGGDFLHQVVFQVPHLFLIQNTRDGSDERRQPHDLRIAGRTEEHEIYI